MRAGLMIAAVLFATACGRRSDSGPVVVSVIGDTPFMADPSRRRMTQSERVLTGAVAEGLVRFDAVGGVEPGLAERWIVIDDGMSYIFRLREATWSDGEPVTATDVVTILKREAAPSNRSPLAPYLSAIDEVVEMTPQIVEVRLRRPRPDLLKLFAQPELAIVRTRPPGGVGPFRIVSRSGPAVLLRPAAPPQPADDAAAEPRPFDDVNLIGERAAAAILRFARRDSDLVTGGNFVDFPVLAAAELAPANVRLDPAAGLFGLAIAQRGGFLADAANRIALAGAFDRTVLATSALAGIAGAETLLPEQLDSASAPVAAPWAGTTVADRRVAARRRVAAWRAGREPPTISVALPAGPGATLLWGQVAATLYDIGVRPVRVPLSDRSADLRLIDRVAPYDSARWYLATACLTCSDAARSALEEARLAPTLPDRARALAAADIALAQDMPFIVLARPLRWSLVSLRLTAWQGNSRAWHPLNHLRNDRNR